MEPGISGFGPRQDRPMTFLAEASV
ncbi:hypothetical protein NC651_019639 [Populus alba x Populus x berolinensis]|nr:hypothetical protein NC651_019639 [Populus alba x Populus x berolinensis]